MRYKDISIAVIKLGTNLKGMTFEKENYLLKNLFHAFQPCPNYEISSIQKSININLNSKISI